jgi:hypothetical protein
MKKLLVILVGVGLFGACILPGPEPHTTSGTASSAGGVGGSGGASSVSSSSSGSTGGGGQSFMLGAGCVGSALELAPPLDLGDGITNGNGTPYREDGAWAVRCFQPPAYPFLVDSFTYNVGKTSQAYPCGTTADHEVILFKTATLPIMGLVLPEVSIPVLASSLTFNAFNFAEVTIGLAGIVEVTSGYVCAGVVLHIQDPNTRTCIVGCANQPQESPDFDQWTSTDIDGGVQCGASGCQLIPFEVAPDPLNAIQFGYPWWHLLYSITGHTK